MSTEVEHILKSLQDRCLHASPQNDAQLLLLALQLKTYAVAVYFHTSPIPLSLLRHMKYIF